LNVRKDKIYPRVNKREKKAKNFRKSCQIKKVINAALNNLN